MLVLDGVEYTVKTPEENVDDLISFINDNCARKKIKNSLGEVIQIDTNEANPLYQICYGVSYLTTILQKLVYNAGCSMSIAEASDRQLLNLADIAGVRRNAATRTIIQGTVTAEENKDPEHQPDVPCEIKQTLRATVNIAGVDIEFSPAFDITINPGETRQIILVAGKDGSFNVAANTITSFDTLVPALKKMTTKASVPGSAQEPISALRARMQRRGVEGTQVDKAAEAIQELPGISLCSIFFNESPNHEVNVGTTKKIVVPPRTALIYVQGASEDVAKVFYRYMFCDTAGKNPDGSVIDGAYKSVYRTRAGQELTVAYFPPEQVDIKVKLFIRNTLTFEQIDGIKEAVSSLAASMSIGQGLTSVEVINVVQAQFTSLNIQGAELSKDGVTWDYRQQPSPDQLFVFNNTNIYVQEVQ